MPFSIRPFRRFPLSSPATYYSGLFEGHGTVWNLSVNGWRLSGDLPSRVGETCSFTVNLPNQQGIYVTAAIVRWVRGGGYGVESLLVEKQAHARLARYVTRLAQQPTEMIA